jgi:prevent-host-death family protein
MALQLEVGIREAKNSLSKLVDAVRGGEEVFLTNHGERVAKLVPDEKSSLCGRGRRLWKGKIHLYPGWDSPEEDKKIEETFEFLNETDSN